MEAVDFGLLGPDGLNGAKVFQKNYLLADGPVAIADVATLSFFDGQKLLFGPTFGVTARQTRGSSGSTIANFGSSLVFTGFSVRTASGALVPFSVVSESGLLYRADGLAAVPEPSSAVCTTLALCAIGLAIRRKTRRVT